ncbi:Siderophore iron transporter [Venturia nashicola]|nr:Siderophore iron transporter [Venturia nashicola]
MVSQTDAVDIVDSALDAGKTWFVDSVSTLLGDQEYSDLRITCQTLELKVHKAIMCTQSKFFRNACKKGAFKEGITGVIDLPDDEPLAVEAMIDFLYTAKWQPEKPAYLLEAQTYVLAEKYGIFALKHAVFSNIHAQLLDRTDMKGFDKAVKWVYSNTTQEDPIRDIFILFVVNDTQNLFDEKNGPISQLVLELPEFSLDILRAIRNGDQFFQTATFYTPINGLNVEEPTTFRCRGCGSDWKLDVNELLGANFAQQEFVCMRLGF